MSVNIPEIMPGFMGPLLEYSNDTNDDLTKNNLTFKIDLINLILECTLINYIAYVTYIYPYCEIIIINYLYCKYLTYKDFKTKKKIVELA